MNKEILKNIWDYLTSQKAIKADFETWTKNFTGNPEVQVNVHKYLLENQAIKADFETWSNNVGLKKKDSSQPISQEDATESVSPLQVDVPTFSESSNAEPEPPAPESPIDPETGLPFDQVPGQEQQQQTAQNPDFFNQEYSMDDGVKPYNMKGQVYDPQSMEGNIPTFMDELTGNYNSQEDDTMLERAIGKGIVTDFFGDLWRAGAAGQVQGGSIDESLELLVKGSNVSDEDVQDYLIAQKALANTPMSDEMRSFNNISENAGGGIWGWMKGVASNPTVLPQLLVSSVSAMVNPTVLTAGAVGSAAGAAIGSTGFSMGPLGVATTAGGAVVGALGAMGTTLETGLTFGELLQEKVRENGDAFDEAGVRKVLENADDLSDLRFKSLGRGLAIGTIEALSTVIGASVGAKMASTAVRGIGLKAGATVIGIEAAGGSLGEVAGMAIAGQDMDLNDILFEGAVGGGTTGPVALSLASIKTAKYSVNPDKPGATPQNSRVSREDMLDIIENSPDDSFTRTNLKIINDPELEKLHKTRADDLYSTGVAKRSILESDPEISERKLNELIPIQKELDKLAENKTPIAKIKKKRLNELYQFILAGKPNVETEEVTKEEAIKSIEEENKANELAANTVNPITNKKGEAKFNIPLTEKNIEERRQQLNNQKLEDAFQKQSTESVDAQKPTTNSTKVGEGNVSVNNTTEQSNTQTSETVQPTEEVTNVTEETVVEDTTIPIENIEIIDDVVTVNTTNAPVETKKPLKRIQKIIRNGFIKKAKQAGNALKILAPKVKIVLHENSKEYENITGKTGKGSFINDTIHINLEKANNTTIAHETFHALLLNILKSDETAGRVTKKMMQSVSKSLKNNPELKKELDDFAANYDINIQNEEKLSEIVGKMAGGYAKFDTSTKSIIQRWLSKITEKLGIVSLMSNGRFTKNADKIGTNDAKVLELLNTIAEKVNTGKEIQQSDVEVIEELREDGGPTEQGDGGEVGTVKVREQKDSRDAPKVETDTRPFAKLVKNKDLSDFDGQLFVTNMYDFTTAGIVDLGNGIEINLFGGKSYVPFMMEKQGKNIGDISNVAAFNTKAQAESFIRNSIEGKANLFMPHSGSVEGSWQFQQAIFEQLTNAALNNKILSKKDIINSFNEVLTNDIGKKSFAQFKNKLGKNIKNFNSFSKNPLEIIELLDTTNNYSPDLRKALNDKLVANKKFQAAIGVKSKEAFAKKMEDVLNEGVETGDIMSVIEFDNTNFEIRKPKKDDADYHPSFAYTILSTIKGVYQPTKFYKSYNITNTYTKHNLSGEIVSRKSKETPKKFKQSNVTSSAGSIPKVAKANIAPREQKDTTVQKLSKFYKMDSEGFIEPGNVYDLNSLEEWAAKIKYRVDRSRGDRGETTKYYLRELGTDKKFKPGLAPREQKDSAPSKRVNKIIDGIIKKTKGRKVGKSTNPKNILTNVIDYLQTSKLYENLTDIERNQLVMDLNKKLGIDIPKSKTAKSVIKSLEKKLGLTNDKTVTKTEKALLKEYFQIQRDSANRGVKYWQNLQKDLIKQIKDFGGKGSLSLNQVTKLIAKILNTTNPKKLTALLDDIENQFAKAKDITFIKELNAMRKVAVAKFKSVLASDPELVINLDALLSIDPSLIPLSVRSEYVAILNQLGERAAVQSLDPGLIVKNLIKINKILNEEYSVIPQLEMIFNDFENKVYNKNGSINYIDTLNKMMDEDVINQEAKDLMIKLKNEILVKEENDAIEKTAAEMLIELTDAINDVRDIKVEINSDKIKNRIWRDAAKSFVRTIRDANLELFEVNELKNIAKILDALNKGYVPIQVMSQLEARARGNTLGVKAGQSIVDATVMWFEKQYGKIKSKFDRQTIQNTAIDEAFERNQMFYIDELLGDFKSKKVFNAVYGDMAVAQQQYAEANSIDADLRNKAEKKVAKSFGIRKNNKGFVKSANKLAASRIRQMIYRIQLEFDSNPPGTPGHKEVNPAASWLDMTYRNNQKIGSNEALAENAEIDNIRNKFSDGDQISAKKIYDSFNSAEKESIKILQDIDKKNSDLAVYAAARRGEGFIPRKNYVHISVKPKAGDPITYGNDILDNFNNNINLSKKTSTKSKASESRTGLANPINLNVYQSAARGTRFTNLDYFMTQAARVSRQSLRAIELELNSTYPKGIPREKLQILNALKKSQKKIIENVLSTDFQENTFGEEALKWLQTMGYRTMLVSGRRFIVEAFSNLQIAIFKPQVFLSGLKIKFKDPEQFNNILRVLKAKTITRMTGGGLQSSKVDNILNKKTRTSDSITSKTEDIIMGAWDATGKKWVNAVELVADKVISTPDRMLMIPMWKGTFNEAFVKTTGKKPNWDKIAANDESYIDANREALEDATNKADDYTTTVGATDNPFMDNLRGKNVKGILPELYNNFNNYMTKFLMGEFAASRRALQALYGESRLSKTEGAKLLAGVTMRMTTYTLGMKVLTDVMLDLMDLKDDEDDEKDIDKAIGQAVASAFTSMIFGRNFGNMTKTLINFGIEEFNKEHLEFLRDGDYDPFDDSIQYNIIKKDGKRGQGVDFGALLPSFLGAYSPPVKTAALIIKKSTEPVRKTESARERQEREINERIPLEILGNSGLIPFYKDFRTLLLADIYKNINKKKPKTAASYTANELEKLKRLNYSEYKNIMLERKMIRYERALKKYQEYSRSPSIWRSENPGKKRPKRPKRPRR